MLAYRVQQSVKIPSVSCENAMKAILQATKPATRVSRRFASRVFSILGVKALNGCTDAKWEGFCNGNGRMSAET